MSDKLQFVVVLAHIDKLKFVARVWTFSPKGIRPPAQGCCTRLPWGKTAGEFPNPNGVVAKPPRVHEPADSFDAEQCRNPVGVARIIAAIPTVAEYSNLGLWASTT
jgi:hypothetical protein